MMNLSDALQMLPGFLIGFTVHEAAHALSAKWLGDDTAFRQGRISLNPLKHLSPMGTVALFFLGFGWGKPVEVNLYNFKKPKFHYLLSSLAGPAANILLCIISFGLLKLLMQIEPRFGPENKVFDVAIKIVFGSYMINAILATLNLIPIPPLDGSKIWACIIPGMHPISSGKWNRVWFIVVLLLLFSGAIDLILQPVIMFFIKVLM